MSQHSDFEICVASAKLARAMQKNSIFTLDNKKLIKEALDSISKNNYLIDKWLVNSGEFGIPELESQEFDSTSARVVKHVEIEEDLPIEDSEDEKSDEN